MSSGISNLIQILILITEARLHRDETVHTRRSADLLQQRLALGFPCRHRRPFRGNCGYRRSKPFLCRLPGFYSIHQKLLSNLPGYARHGRRRRSCRTALRTPPTSREEAYRRHRANIRGAKTQRNSSAADEGVWLRAPVQALRRDLGGDDDDHVGTAAAGPANDGGAEVGTSTGSGTSVDGRDLAPNDGDGIAGYEGKAGEV